MSASIGSARPDAGRCRGTSGLGVDVGAPLVPALDVPWLMPAPAGWSGGSRVEEAAERSGEVRFAVTALRLLPSDQTNHLPP